MKIAVIRFSSLGDLALMIPMLNAIKGGTDNCTIHVLTKDTFRDLLKGVGCIDRLITVKSKSVVELTSILNELNEERYDVVIDAHNIALSNIFYKMVKAPLKLQLRKESVKKSLLILFKINLYREKISLYDKYMELARQLAANASDGDVEFVISEDEKRRIEPIIKEVGLQEGNLVALAPGARWKTKRWPEENFAQLAMKIMDKGFTPVLVGGKEDIGICERIRMLSDNSIVDLSGKLSIIGTAELLRKVELLVTNDSAPLHLAELVGTPVVAMYGPTVREFGYFPRLPGSIALEKKMWCRPCSRNGSRFARSGREHALMI